LTARCNSDKLTQQTNSSAGKFAIPIKRKKVSFIKYFDAILKPAEKLKQ